MNELERKCFRCLVCDGWPECAFCQFVGGCGEDCELQGLCPNHPSYVRTQLEQERLEAHLLYYALNEMMEGDRESPVDPADPPAWACDQDPYRCSWHGILVEQYDGCPICDFEESVGWIDGDDILTRVNGVLHVEPIFRAVVTVIDGTVDGPDDWSPAEPSPPMSENTRIWLMGDCDD